MTKTTAGSSASSPKHLPRPLSPAAPPAHPRLEAPAATRGEGKSPPPPTHSQQFPPPKVRSQSSPENPATTYTPGCPHPPRCAPSQQLKRERCVPDSSN